MTKWEKALKELRVREAELIERVRQLEGENKALVIKNKFLRERPDLPVDRIPVYETFCREIIKANEEIDTLKSKLRRIE